MPILTRAILIATALSLISSAAPTVAQTKKPAPKPARPASVKPAQPAGPFGRIDALPELGVQITLLSAEYTLDPVNIGDNRMAPKADQKLLLVRFKVQNAKSGDLVMPLTGAMIQAVAQDDATYSASEALGYEAKSVYVGAETRKPASELILKRVQNAPTCVAVIPVPADGPVPKLIVDGKSGTVLRYDLRGKVKPLPTPDRAPDDSSGLSARKEFVWKVGETARTWGMDFTVEKAEATADPALLTRLGADPEMTGAISATVKIVVQTPYEKYLFNSDNSLEMKVFDTDGNAYDASVLAASRIADFDVVKHGNGSQVRVRLAATFPRAAKLDRIVFVNKFWASSSENPTIGGGVPIEPSRPYIFPGDRLFPGGLNFPAPPA